MKTRSKKPAASSKKNISTSAPAASVKTLEPSVQDPPQVFVWPKDISSSARVLTLPNPATDTANRYLLCPEKGCYEFTRVAGPKREKRSWLLAPDRQTDIETQTNADEDQGYVLQTPDLMVATPIDPMFLLLPALAQDHAGKQMYLITLDYLERLEERSEHLKQMLRQDQTGQLERIFQDSMLSVCDIMDAGDETMCKLSMPKLQQNLLAKAKKMIAKGLPASMEERFVKQALAVPVLCVRREESSVSMADADNTGAGAESASAQTSQDTQMSDTSSKSFSTAATSIASAPVADSSLPTTEVTDLLRLRTALTFLLHSYVPVSLRETLMDRATLPVDFQPLDTHLAHLAKLKQEALALRSISDNISRKRNGDDDEEAIERAEAKKRKKEEEEARKKNVSVGIKKLNKVDVSGMKKMSSFFTTKSKV